MDGYSNTSKTLAVAVAVALPGGNLGQPRWKVESGHITKTDRELLHMDLERQIGVPINIESP